MSLSNTDWLRNKYKAFCIFLLLPFWGLAEQNGGIAYLRIAPETEQVLELQTGCFFIAHPYTSQFSRILLEAYVKRDGQYDGIQLKTKAVLYNERGKKIGKVLKSFNPIQEFDWNDTLVKVWVEGVLDNASIDPQTVPEIQLETLLMRAELNAKKEYFDTFLNGFKLVAGSESGDYSSFLLNDFNFLTRKFQPRLLLIFYKDELISVFHHRPLRAKIYDSIEIGAGFGMIYNSKFSENSKASLMEIYKSKFRD